MITALRTIARLELVAAARRRWIQRFTAAFALLAVVISWSAGAVNELGSADGFARTTVALLPLVLTLVPLVALLLGISGQSGDAGSEGYLFAQPVTRVEIIVGRWIGQAIALSSAIVLGLGAGAVFVASSAGTVDLMRFVSFVAVVVALGLVFLSVAALASATTSARTSALGIGALVWFVAVLLYDGAVLAVAGWLTGRSGGYVLFTSVFGNPADLVRVLALSLSGTPHLLGAAGESWSHFLGGPTAAILLSTGALVVWMAAPLALAARLLAHRDL